MPCCSSSLPRHAAAQHLQLRSQLPSAPPCHSWVTKVDQFVQLSDLPQERRQASHLKCLGHVAAAIAQTGGDRNLTDRVAQVGRGGSSRALAHPGASCWDHVLLADSGTKLLKSTHHSAALTARVALQHGCLAGVALARASHAALLTKRALLTLPALASLAAAGGAAAAGGPAGAVLAGGAAGEGAAAGV